ncbi:MAG TPA: FecR domain-containing protein [Candidatus Omnitrophota bacterium]|nr:FecR domain-containing protein [Candidatus Omnitrophota bacterium]
MQNKQISFILACLLVPAIAFAQSSARDSDIDLKLNAGDLAGVAPPTGSQAIPLAPAAGPQKFIDPYLPAAMQGGAVILGQTDGKARVYEVKGDAKRSSAGSPIEKKLKKGDTIKAGDTIITGSGSVASITFDENYKNAVYVPENSQALIVSIEPTEIKIQNGSVYSAIDGLPHGSTWKITTPVAIAAVRGTLYVVRFVLADGTFYAATVNVPDDDKTSSIDIQELTGETGANVPEGKEITFKDGEIPDASLVSDLDPSTVQEILDFFQNLKELRDQNDNSGVAPPTSGDLTGTNNLDPAGPGVVGGGSDPLDPINDIGLPPEPLSEAPSSGEESYGECQGEQCYSYNNQD